MIRRAAALLALVAFTGAWLVGVWSHEPPRARMVSAALAALFGAVAGAAIGVALERIVLARLMEQWETASRAAAEAAKTKGRKGARAPQPSNEGGGDADADAEIDREPEPAAEREPQDALA
jgi:membrane protein YqaA with SNARE-associated domain